MIYRLYLTKDTRTSIDYDRFIGYTRDTVSTFYIKKVSLWDIRARCYKKEKVMLKRTGIDNENKIIGVEVNGILL
jgi:hypothetical protein